MIKVQGLLMLAGAAVLLGHVTATRGALGPMATRALLHVGLKNIGRVFIRLPGVAGHSFDPDQLANCGRLHACFL
jgi:hypothetical protein